MIEIIIKAQPIMLVIETYSLSNRKPNTTEETGSNKLIILIVTLPKSLVPVTTKAIANT